MGVRPRLNTEGGGGVASGETSHAFPLSLAYVCRQPLWQLLAGLPAASWWQEPMNTWSSLVLRMTCDV